MENKKQLIVELATARAIRNEIENLFAIDEFYEIHEKEIDKALLEIVRDINNIKERLKK